MQNPNSKYRSLYGVPPNAARVIDDYLKTHKIVHTPYLIDLLKEKGIFHIPSQKNIGQYLKRVKKLERIETYTYQNNQ